MREGANADVSPGAGGSPSLLFFPLFSFCFACFHLFSFMLLRFLAILRLCFLPLVGFLSSLLWWVECFCPLIWYPDLEMVSRSKMRWRQDLVLI
ncbi:unnamed protein product [Linum trigynum]|uniref:Transmembrane protein n=1 Tax=Linum trigynum TaxID=586398 RepID=A0AAV2D247_9ROSI